MHGNVWEWCSDSYQDKLLGGTDPEVTVRAYWVFRGGSWDGVRGYCRSAFRGGGGAGYRIQGIGFRLAAVQSR